jgi:hypothetical protein
MRYIKIRVNLSLNTFDDCLGFLYNEIERSSRNVTFKYALLEYHSPIY